MELLREVRKFGCRVGQRGGRGDVRAGRRGPDKCVGVDVPHADCVRMRWKARYIGRKTEPAERYTASVCACHHSHGAAGGELILVLVAQLLPVARGVELPRWRLEHPIRTMHKQLT